MKKIITSLPFQLVLGVAAAWTKAEQITGILEEFQKVVLAIVSRVVIPILPVFIGVTFWTLSYEETITKQLPVFIWIVLIVIAGHFRHSLQHYRGRRADHDPVRVCPEA